MIKWCSERRVRHQPSIAETLGFDCLEWCKGSFFEFQYSSSICCWAFWVDVDRLAQALFSFSLSHLDFLKDASPLFLRTCAFDKDATNSLWDETYARIFAGPTPLNEATDIFVAQELEHNVQVAYMVGDWNSIVIIAWLPIWTKPFWIVCLRLNCFVMCQTESKCEASCCNCKCLSDKFKP